jgi:hypothetical protein
MLFLSVQWLVVIMYCTVMYLKSKAVLLHAMEAHGGEEV